MKIKQTQLTKAQNKLVKENLGLIGFVLERWAVCLPESPAFDRNDKFQAGFFGLRRAAQKFDPAKGCKFSTYATSWIFQSIMRAIHLQGFRTVRVPVYMHGAAWKDKSEDAKNGMAEPLDIDDLFNVLKDDNHQAIKNLTQFEIEVDVNEAIAQLPWRERMIIRYRFGFVRRYKSRWQERTLSKIGKRFGISHERVRQIQEGAMLKLKKMCHNYSDI